MHIAILALVQGVTEFLPISSSGHLILVWQAFDSLDPRVAEAAAVRHQVLDVAVHLGTLVAVMIYVWADLWRMATALVRPDDATRARDRMLIVYIVVATLPVVVVGFLGKDYITERLRAADVVGWSTVCFGVLLYAADRMSVTLKRLDHLTLGGVIFIGCAQVLALIPGTSRSGITMTAARLLGFERDQAARFSMLLAIPAILGAATLIARDLYDMGDAALGLDALLAAVLSLIAALVAIYLMMAWLRRATFTPFVVYRLALGALLLVLIYRGDIPLSLGV